MLIFLCGFIIICAALNHLGGQAAIPGARIACRVVGVGVAYGTLSLLCGLPFETAGYAWAVCTAGMALWAVWKWGPGFMAVKENAGDRRDYSTSRWGFNYWNTRMTDFILDVNRWTVLSIQNIRTWGMVYMTLRGTLMYPMFVGLAFTVTPWAYLIGLICLTQGIIYRLNRTVYNAEYFEGGIVIGGGLTATIIMRFYGI